MIRVTTPEAGHVPWHVTPVRTSACRFQLERLRCFAVDSDSRPGALVLNRTVTLKESGDFQRFGSTMIAARGGLAADL